MIDPALVLIVQLAVAALFAWAAWHKLHEWPRMAGVLAGYRVAPDWATLTISKVIIILEISVALGALIYPPAMLGAAVVLFAYAGVIGFNIARGNDRIDCGCTTMGTSGPRLVWAMVFRNITIALIAILAAIVPSAARPLLWVDLLSVASALPVLCALYAALDLSLALPKKDLQ